MPHGIFAMRDRDPLPEVDRPPWVAFCLSACEPRCAEQDIRFTAGVGRKRKSDLPRFVLGTDINVASLGRAFQADDRGFSPIEGGLEGGGSVS